MIKAVIIDVDDTLCMTEIACFAIENQTLRAMGRAPMSHDIHLATWGQPLLEVIQLRSPGIDAARFFELFWPIQDQAIAEGKLDTISPATYDAFDTLLAQNKALFLLTSRQRNELKHMLAPAHKLAKRISGFYYLENTRFHKPDPRVFDDLLTEHDLQPGECVYVGDSLSDATAAKQAGIYFIASLESGLRPKETFDGLNVDACIPSLTELPDAIRQLEP